MAHQFHVDEASRSLLVSSDGIWSRHDVIAYRIELRSQIGALRARFGKVRVLVDARQVGESGPEVRKELSKLSDLFVDSSDRLAIVVPTSLRKQEIGRNPMPQAGQAFTSVEAARLWLFAYD